MVVVVVLDTVETLWMTKPISLFQGTGEVLVVVVEVKVGVLESTNPMCHW